MKDIKEYNQFFSDFEILMKSIDRDFLQMNKLKKK